MGKWLLMTEVGTFSVSEDGKGIAVEFPDGQEANLYHEQFRQWQTLFTTFVKTSREPPKPLNVIGMPVEPVEHIEHIESAVAESAVVAPQEGPVGPTTTEVTTPNPFITSPRPSALGPFPPRATHPLAPPVTAQGVQVVHPRYGKPVPVVGMREVATPLEHLPPGVTPEMERQQRLQDQQMGQGGIPHPQGGAPHPQSGAPHLQGAPQPIRSPNTHTSLRRQPSLNSSSMGRRPQESPPARGIPSIGTGAVPGPQNPPRQGQPQPVRPNFTRSIDRMRKP